MCGLQWREEPVGSAGYLQGGDVHLHGHRDEQGRQTGTASISYTVLGPPTATISSPANNQTYNLGASVATSSSCADPNGPGIASCVDSNGARSPSGQLDTSKAGTFTYTVTATSKDGQTATASITYTVLGPPTATISSPANNQTYNLGASVATSFSCADPNGPGIASCVDSNGASGGTGQLSTSTAGTFTYKVTSTSNDGQTGTTSITYTVVGPPTAKITAPASNQTYKLNQKVATKFSCADAQGAPGIASCTDSNGASGATGQLEDLRGRNVHVHRDGDEQGRPDGHGEHHVHSVEPADGDDQLAGEPPDIQPRCVGGDELSCADPNGPGIATCLDSNGASAGAGQLSTAKAGTFTYKVTATSKDGQTGTASITYTVAGPPTAKITAPSNHQSYNLNQAVATTFTCTEAARGPGIASCVDSNGATGGTGQLNTSTAGTFTYTVTATSQDGQTGTASITYTVVGPPTAGITAPSDNASYAFGTVPNASFKCTEATGGPGIKSCTATIDGNAVANGARLTATAADAVGPHTMIVTAVSKDGQSAAATIGYSVSQASTSLTAAPQEVLYPPPTGIGLGKVSATLMSDGANVGSETITFSVPATNAFSAQTLCAAQTNAHGTASCKLTTAQENEVMYAGSYDASFAGDANYLGSSASTPFIVQGSGTASSAGVHGARRESITGGALTRGAVVYATAVVSRGHHSQIDFALRARRPIRAGRYTLTVRFAGGLRIQRAFVLPWRPKQ